MNTRSRCNRLLASTSATASATSAHAVEEPVATATTGDTKTVSKWILIVNCNCNVCFLTTLVEAAILRTTVRGMVSDSIAS